MSRTDQRPGTDQRIEFRPVNIAVLTVSDSRTIDDDRSGNLLADRVRAAGHALIGRAIVADELDAIVAQLAAWRDDPKIEVVVTTGGTGVTGRDVTPEALAPNRLREGDSWIRRDCSAWISYREDQAPRPSNRGLPPGSPSGTYLFAVPGSPGACKDGWDEILAAQLDIRHRPCNFAELLPRLREHE